MDHKESKGSPEKASTCFTDYAKDFDWVDPTRLWKALKEMGIPEHLTRLLRNLFVGQEVTVRMLYTAAHWFRIEKGVGQGCLMSPCLFKLYSEHIMRIACWMSYKLQSRLPGEISKTSDMQVTPSLWQHLKRTKKASS